MFGLLSLVVLLGGADRGPEIVRAFHYYEIQGRTRRQLHESLGWRRMLALGNTRYDAETRWRVRWHLDLGGLDSCALTRVETSVEVVTKMPRWRPPGDAASQLVERWQRYVAAMHAHEDGHARIAAAAAETLVQRFRELGPADDCDALRSRIDEAAKRILHAAHQEDVAYDRRTVHGRRQGAHFP